MRLARDLDSLELMASEKIENYYCVSETATFSFHVLLLTVDFILREQSERKVWILEVGKIVLGHRHD